MILVLRPDDDTRRTAMFKNSHLRLLMRLVGFERLAPSVEESPESVWIVPSHLSADQLKESIEFINMAEFDPPVFDNDESAEEQLRRKSAVRKKAAFDDDGMDEDDDDGILFPAGGPTARKIADEAAGRKTKRRRRRRNDGEEGEGPTEEELDERAQRRREKELEKARRVKSEMYVHASDDETDDERDAEFFAREEAIRKRVQLAMFEDAEEDSPVKLTRTTTIISDDSGSETAGSGKDSPSGKAGRKRKSSPLAADVDAEDARAMERTAPRKKKRAIFLDSSDEDEDLHDVSRSSQASVPRGPADDVEDMDTDDTPLSSSPHESTDKPLGAAPGPPLLQPEKVVVDTMEDGDEMPISVARRARGKARSGFLVDSSDEE